MCLDRPLARPCLAAINSLICLSQKISKLNVELRSRVKKSGGMAEIHLDFFAFLIRTIFRFITRIILKLCEISPYSYSFPGAVHVDRHEDTKKDSTR